MDFTRASTAGRNASRAAGSEVSLLTFVAAGLALVFCYLCGSIPFGLILTRLTGAPDVRSVGSGNIGATNVLRSGHKGLAAATLAGDMLKGTIDVLAVIYICGRQIALL